MRARFFTLVFACCAVACAGGDETSTKPPTGTDAGLDASDTSGLDTSIAETSEDTAPPDDVSVPDFDPDSKPPIGDTYVYAHSDARLYRLDAKTLAVTEIGEFQDTSGSKLIGITDIALDKDANMYGISFGVLYAIDYKAKGGPMCKQLATLDTEFNGLTFVPEGMIDVGKEVLIGVATDGGWWRIDVKTGSTSATTTKLGSYGGGLASSGDTVGIIGDKVYATVEGTTGPGDHVIIVDPKTGAKVKDLGDTGVPGLWGVGYWGGVMYGFKSDGSLYSIDLATAKATLIPLTTKPDNGWWGAGVRTSAPNSIPK